MDDGLTPEAVAMHEGGHYVVGVAVGVPVQEAHLEPVELNGGVLVPRNWQCTATLLDAMTFYLGGYAGEREILHQQKYRHPDDEAAVWRALSDGNENPNIMTLPPEWFLGAEYPAANLAYHRACQIVFEQQASVRRIAETLQAYPNRLVGESYLRKIVSDSWVGPPPAADN